MPKINNQSGFAQLLILGVLVFGIFTAVFLSQKPQIFQPKADEVLSAVGMPVKIMAVGDSLTHGVKNASTDAENVMAGYRYYLYNNLVAAGTQVDMVGSLSAGPSVLADRNHEGYNGYDCSLLGSIIGPGVSTYQPDVVLLMCGINDFAQPRTDQFRAEAINHLESVINNISSAAPNTKIIVSTIVNSDIDYIPNLQTNILNFNNSIPALIAKKYSEGKKVYLVDMFNGLTNADLSDHIHPNESGYQKMSDVWQNILKPVLTSANPSGLIANYSFVKPGAIETVSWFNLINNGGASWIGLYKSDVPDGQIASFITWLYLGNCSNNQGTPVSSPKVGMCKITLPANIAQGQYEFRLYLQGTTLAQKSNKFTVSTSGFPLVSPPPTITPSPSLTPSPSVAPSPSQSTQNIISASPGSVSAGAYLSINWQNLIGNSGASWIGLYKTSEPLSNIGAFKDWMYLGNCSRTAGTPASSPATGSCSFTVPAGTQPGTYEIRMFLQGTTFTSKSNQIQIN